MTRALWPAVVLVIAIAGCSRANTAQSLLEDAQSALGNPDSIQFSATGEQAFFGQSLTAGDPWPMRRLTGYTKTINYAQRSAREELDFAEPVFGGQQQNMHVRGDRAWTVGPSGPVPQLATAEERELHIWLTPHGFIRGALASGNATVADGSDATTVSFTALGKYKVNGTIDAANRVTRVQTAMANPVLGDMPIVASYSDYENVNGIQFPRRILIEQGGFPIWDLNVTSVTPNAPADLPVPENVQAATNPPVQTTTAALAPGVWHIMGGSHHSVLVEFDDYLAVVEAPLNEERSMAVIAQAKKLVPNKPIRYLLTTHHHFDHIGGLRTHVNEGSTIVTHQANVPYLQKTVMAPSTILPDLQAKNPMQPTFEAVSDRYVITDGTQAIEVYATAGDTHTDEYTLIYLPGPRILIEADAWSPGPADAPPPAAPPPNAVMLYDEIQRLKLNVATIAPIHGRGAAPIAELRAFIGR